MGLPEDIRIAIERHGVVRVARPAIGHASPAEIKRQRRAYRPPEPVVLPARAARLVPEPSLDPVVLRLPAADEAERRTTAALVQRVQAGWEFIDSREPHIQNGVDPMVSVPPYAKAAVRSAARRGQ